MSSDRVLYWGSGSPPCWRVMIALAEKQLEYDSKLLEFSKKEHKSPEVLAINPRGQLPTFKDGSVVVNESVAAILYLEEAYESGTQLLPKDVKARAQVYQRTMEMSALSEALSSAVGMAMAGSSPPDAMEQKLEALRVELCNWERYFVESEYLAGPEFSLADVAIAPLILSAQRWGVKYGAKYPNLQKYADLVGQRPSVAATIPPHWVGTPNKELMAAV